MLILGIHAFAHDSAACILSDDGILAAAEEERFSRQKHTTAFPYNAIEYCLKCAGATLHDIDYVGFGWQPWLGFGNRVANLLKNIPQSLMHKSEHVPKWFNIIRTKSFLNNGIDLSRKKLKYKFYFVDHHLCHFYTAYYLSPFDESLVITVDAAGEWKTATFGIARGENYEIKKVINYPDSIGFFYSAVTQFLGFKALSGEGKVMGLAPYGEPEYYDDCMKIAGLKDNKDLVLELDYFRHQFGDSIWFSDKMKELWGPARIPESEVTERDRNIAASIQKRAEDIIVSYIEQLLEKENEKNLCIAGGVALNGCINGQVLKRTPIEHIYVHSAANDAGPALGAALYIYHHVLKKPKKFVIDHAYFGPEYSHSELKKSSQDSGLNYKECEHITQVAAKLLSEGKILGWFQGRMEWGPRALGNRSILANPRMSEMKDILNARVKHREGFRPFAPSILEEKTSQYFDITQPVPFMTVVCKVLPEKSAEVPAITHVDGTARLQTVSKTANPLYWKLIFEFEKLTGTPIILNTSFNVRGEPIICSPEDAILCFKKTDMDYLVLGNFLLWK
ncbi:carbamoyltransferase [bacterium]|nr:carbamoyltransferase [bacterium]